MDSRDSDQDDSDVPSTPRIFFGNEMSSPEKKLVAFPDDFKTPLLAEPNPTRLPPCPATPTPNQHTDDAVLDELNRCFSGPHCETPPPNIMLSEDEPSSVLASRIIRAHDNPSPPPRAHIRSPLPFSFTITSNLHHLSLDSPNPKPLAVPAVSSSTDNSGPTFNEAASVSNDTPPDITPPNDIPPPSPSNVSTVPDLDHILFDTIGDEPTGTDVEMSAIPQDDEIPRPTSDMKDSHTHESVCPPIPGPSTPALANALLMNVLDTPTPRRSPRISAMKGPFGAVPNMDLPTPFFFTQSPTPTRKSARVSLSPARGGNSPIKGSERQHKRIKLTEQDDGVQRTLFGNSRERSTTPGIPELPDANGTQQQPIATDVNPKAIPSIIFNLSNVQRPEPGSPVRLPGRPFNPTLKSPYKRAGSPMRPPSVLSRPDNKGQHSAPIFDAPSSVRPLTNGVLPTTGKRVAQVTRKPELNIPKPSSSMQPGPASSAASTQREDSRPDAQTSICEPGQSGPSSPSRKRRRSRSPDNDDSRERGKTAVNWRVLERPKPTRTTTARPNFTTSKIPRMGTAPKAAVKGLHPRPPPSSLKKPPVLDLRPSRLPSPIKPRGAKETGTMAGGPDHGVSGLGSTSSAVTALLKRKREAEASSSSPIRPVIVRQVVPGMFGGAKIALPTSEKEDNGSSVTDTTIETKRLFGTRNDGDRPTGPVETDPGSLELAPKEQPACDAIVVDPTPPTSEPPALVTAPGGTRTSTRPTRQRRTLAAVDVFGPKIETGVGKARKKGTGPGAAKSEEAMLRTLTNANTAQNQRINAALETVIVKREGDRPESPGMKLKTILQKRKDEQSKDRSERARRRSAASNSDLSSEMNVDDLESTTSAESKHTLGAGDDEDYETPERPGRAGKRVKWDRGLIQTVFLDELEFGADLPHRAMDERTSRKIIKNVGFSLDSSGNVVVGAPLVLEPEKVVVKKFVYENDEEEPAPPPPPPVKQTRKRAQKTQ